MEVEKNALQGRVSPQDNVIAFEAARERQLLRKARGYREPSREVKMVSAYLRRHPFPPLMEEGWAKLTNRRPLAKTERKDNVIDVHAVRQELQSGQRQCFWDRRKWHEVAKEHGWGDNPDWPNDGFYVDRIVERAEQLGLDPLTISPEERKELTVYGGMIIEQARKLGLDPRTLTSQDRRDLYEWGRIPSDEERRKKAENVAKLLVNPTPEGWNRLAEHFLKQHQVNQKIDEPPLPPELLKRFAQNLKEKGFIETLIELMFAIFDYPVANKR